MDSDESSITTKSTKITLTGDVKSCSHCKEEDEKFRKFAGDKFDYEYVDVNSDQGQKNLETYGVKEGEKVDIPITKVETCEWSKDKPQERKCKTTDFKDDWWSDVESGNLPKDLQ